MTDYSALLKTGIAAGRRKREPTKLECAMLGALLASSVISLAIYFWLGTLM